MGIDITLVSHDVLQFTGPWVKTKLYPIGTAEAQGKIIGDDLVVISGFKNGISSATNKNYALNLRNSNANWREMDDLPVAEGITHGAFAQAGTKVYMCGGYVLKLLVVEDD